MCLCDGDGDIDMHAWAPLPPRRRAAATPAEAQLGLRVHVIRPHFCLDRALLSALVLNTAARSVLSLAVAVAWYCNIVVVRTHTSAVFVYSLYC